MSKYPPRSNARQQLLSNQDFLSGLAQLLTQSSGSVYLTQKKLDPQYVTSTTLGGIVGNAEESQLLFRATNGKDQKLSTRVDANNLASFMDKYGEVCRAGMSAGLKKRDRKKTKKTK